MSRKVFYGIAKFADPFLLYHHALDKVHLLLFIAHHWKLPNRFFGNHGHSRWIVILVLRPASLSI